MCGLVGLVQRFVPDARVDRVPLRQATAALAEWSASADDAGPSLEAIALALDEVSLALLAWGGFRSLREDASLRELVSGLGARLDAVADDIEARLSDPGQVCSTQDAEGLARAVVAARDVAWRLSKDALPNLDSAAALLPAGAELEQKGWFELWRINLVLNQLARLEVRGRDSGGLATLVSLSRAAWDQARASLPPETAEDLQRRLGIPSLRDGAVLLLEGPERVALAFAHKVAREVGELGANVRDLREKLRADALHRALITLPSAQVQVMAHTRWASNGVISEPNCHPVANDLREGTPRRLVLGALNGDVDNFPSLSTGWAIPADCTTDAKIIPLEIDRHLESEGGVTAAVLRAAASFHGSTAIGALISDDPHATHLALRGSGQAIYVGVLADGGALYASELYGVVELAPQYYKLDGEDGEVVRLADDGPSHVVSYAGAQRPLDLEELKTAPIATRDIDRAGHDHYFLKEVGDSPRSVERTLRGKFVLEDGERARFLMGDDVIPPRVRAKLSAGEIQRVFVIGQGTAAVAGRAAAEFMAKVLRPAAIEVLGMPATELSGFYLDHLGPEVVVVAVSQSGTTTDTNRTVDLARQRGAHVIGIVNRRGSDLADKSHGVLYTSDGRDVEMSVASTKAFYCQVVAGYLLALQLAELAGAISEADLASRLLRIQDLPRCLRTVLEETRERVRLAAQLALRRTHWTVVGSGPLYQAAREIRIKLSELCYKSVSVDTIEDKKHIDLSSEPLVLVCAAGLSGAAAADAVKEVAIFKAHAASPVVICDRGETRFAEYAAATIHVPASSPEVALLLNTIAGHLFSYEAARAIDECTGVLRRARDVTDAALDSLLVATRDAAPADAEETLLHFRGALAPLAREIREVIEDGRWTAAMTPAGAVGLLSAMRMAQGVLPGRLLNGEQPTAQVPPTALELVEHLQGEIARALDALRRPIDAIKHQAKTVTVGISREAAAIRPPAGPLVQAFEACGIAPYAISDQDAAALASLEPAVDACLGAVHYRLEALSPLGAPIDASRIVVEKKTGVAEQMGSRADTGAPLSGTKRKIVRAPRVWIGHGQRDGRSLLMCPLYTGGLVSGLGLMHVRFRESIDTSARVRALRAVGRYEDLKCAVTEWDVPWDDALLDELTVERLLTTSPERLAEALQGEDAPVSEATGGGR